ncbi:37S ribosomal protein S22 [Mycoemilia scoparia]|uniref:37S ribosomal protein S22 n=1 Tax=Mycoemilia scoparia TaxID=417184 RepID=A0A9W7ZYH4_9FUNG|nr:37S ribosomal protein S22 [Mycoemilia scoparia]
MVMTTKKDKKLIRVDSLRIADSLRSTGIINPPYERITKKEPEDLYINGVLQKKDNNNNHNNDNNGHGSHGASKSDKTTPQAANVTVASLLDSTKRLSPHTLEYGARESAAYVASRFPATYGALFNIMKEAKARIPWMKPNNVLDFGTGPGTALWAINEVWNSEVKDFTGVDISEDMLQSAEEIIKYASDNCKFENIEFKRYLAASNDAGKFDLVVCAFSLSELPSDNIRKSTIQNLWAHTKDTLVIVDRGTPQGAKIVMEARNWILEHSKPESTNGEASVHTVAPYSHDMPCPFLNTKEWSHYSQRVQRPTFTMKTKHSKSNREDLKYSYVILRRGSRPQQSATTGNPPSTVDISESTQGTSTSTDQQDKDSNNNLEQLALASYSWPRVISPALKRSGHVIVEVCTDKGRLERRIFTKSHNPQAYRDARKVAWGDLFPHEPKVILPYPNLYAEKFDETKETKKKRISRSLRANSKEPDQ